MTPSPLEPPAWHALAATEVAERLGTDPAAGLRADESAARLARIGPNQLEPPKRSTLPELLWEAATEPFVLLLLAAGLLAILLSEVRDGLLVLVGLLPIVGAAVVTEHRGERALEALRVASAPHARVRRDGAAHDVPAAELVPGDVVLLRSGDVVPADLRLSVARGLLVDRSVLTGESVPEPGDPDTILAADEPLTGRRTIAYQGTNILGGWGEGLVVATGRATELGRIAGSLGDPRRRRSPLQRELDRLVRILLAVAIGLIAIVTVLGFARGGTLGATLLAGISAAIAAIPEEPPVLLGVVLGLGAYRLLRRGVLVRRLNAEETLGAVDLIVTDKTGTLTANRLAVRTVRTLAGEVAPGPERERLVGDALMTDEALWRTEGHRLGSFSRALLDELGADQAGWLRATNELLDATPFSQGALLSRVRVRSGTDGDRELRLGAPEAVIDPGEGPAAEAWDALAVAGAAAGERVLALADRVGERWRTLALIGFADALRADVAGALALAHGAGIQVLMVTGDHPETAAAIGRAVGLAPGRTATGEELDRWSDGELDAGLRDLRVVARARPEQKMRLVQAARRMQRTVASTGDGVNDAPALHASDVAVAMGSGAAVAKEAADLVLGDDSFATLMFGLREGRRIVDNVLKGLVFLTSTHVALLGFILVATLAGYSQPLLPIQILWLEFFIDLSASVAFEREPPEPDLMRRPPRPRGTPLLTRRILGGVVLAGGFSALAALGLMSWVGGGVDHARWVAYTALVVAQVVRANANRSLSSPVLALRPNGFLLLTTAAVIAIQVAIPFVPLLADAFRASPLHAGDWPLVAAIAVAPWLVAEVVRATRRTIWVA